MKVSHYCLLIFMFIAAPKVQSAFEGTMTLNSPLKYKSWFKEKVAPEGDYIVKLKQRSRSFKIKLKNSTSGNLKFKIKVPRHSFSEDGGSLSLSSEQTGQPFGIEANLDISRNRSEGRQRVESCTYRRPVRRCYTNEEGRRICETRYQEVRGNQRVHYYVLAVERNLTVDFIEDTNLESAGVFSGREIYRQTVETYRGPCRQWE